MSSRLLRALVLVVLTTFVSGAPQVLAAALDDGCCTEPCGGDLDGKHCPPNCGRGECTKKQASIAAALAPSDGPAVTMVRTVVLAQTSPRLPLVVTSVFHPPIA